MTSGRGGGESRPGPRRPLAGQGGSAIARIVPRPLLQPPAKAPIELRRRRLIGLVALRSPAEDRVAMAWRAGCWTPAWRQVSRVGLGVLFGNQGKAGGPCFPGLRASLTEHKKHYRTLGGGLLSRRRPGGNRESNFVNGRWREAPRETDVGPGRSRKDEARIFPVSDRESPKERKHKREAWNFRSRACVIPFRDF